jgi:hypothetical protein
MHRLADAILRAPAVVRAILGIEERRSREIGRLSDYKVVRPPPQRRFLPRKITDKRVPGNMASYAS